MSAIWLIIGPRPLGPHLLGVAFDATVGAVNLGAAGSFAIASHRIVRSSILNFRQPVLTELNLREENDSPERRRYCCKDTQKQDRDTIHAPALTFFVDLISPQHQEYKPARSSAVAAANVRTKFNASTN